MLIDLEKVQDETRFTADICIIGAGPAGITIAKELANSRLSVVLAESGSRKDDHNAVSLYEGLSIGHPVDLTTGRYRIFGGASTRWGGRCALLDPLDFEDRPWIPLSGWPVSYDQLSPFYRRALEICNFKEKWLSPSAVYQSLGIQFPEFTYGKLAPFVWRMAAPELAPTFIRGITLGYRAAFNFGRAYADVLEGAENIRVLHHANLVEFHADKNATGISSARFSSLSRRTVEVLAKRFVVACSGIENARILLNLPQPLLEAANKYDQIGRCFAQHPRGVIGTVEASQKQALALQRTFNIFVRPRRIPIQYEVGLALTEKAQRKDALLNASVALNYEADDESIWMAGKRLRDVIKRRRPLQMNFLADLATVVFGASSVGGNIARRWVLGREIIHKNPVIRAVIDLEQAPRPNSRISLLDERDSLGMRKAVVNWMVGDLERKTAAAFGEFLDEELRHNGMGELRKSQWLNSDEPVGGQHLYGNLHFIGATRMSKSARDGTVDANCRVFGIENLYMAGASVFPIGGHANPTVTIVALAVRLADHLRNSP